MMRERDANIFIVERSFLSVCLQQKTTRNEQLKSHRLDSRFRRSDVFPKSNIRREIALRPLRESNRIEICDRKLMLLKNHLTMCLCTNCTFHSSFSRFRYPPAYYLWFIICSTRPASLAIYSR